MASNTEDISTNVDADATTMSSCLNDPNYAIICVFLQKFGALLNIEHPDFSELQQMVENTDEIPTELRDFLVKLLRKTRKSVQPNKLDAALAKFCYSYSSQDAWEVERFGFKKSSLAVKLRILKEILESQFEKNPHFRAIVSKQSATELRSQPLGKDKLGNAYWSTLDDKCNLRIYQEHLDEEIWKVVATNRDEMVNLIACLKGNKLVLPSLVGIIDEDSSSNSMPPKVDALQNHKESSNDGHDNVDSDSVKKENIPNLKIKLNTANKDESTVEQVKNESIDDETNETLLNNNDEDDEDEEDDENDSNVAEIDEMSRASSENSSATAGTRSTETQGSKRFSLLASKPPSNKSKSIQRSRNLNTSETSTASKKRQLNMDSDTETSKSKRPSMLATNKNSRSVAAKNIGRSGKASKSSKQEDEDEDMDDAEEQGEEEEVDEEEEDEEEEEEEEEEEDLSEISGDEVGEEIEDPVMYVHGEGSGKSNKCGATITICDNDSHNDEVGEAIEEEVFYIYGEGAGYDCDVGNVDPKAQEISSNANSSVETPPSQEKRPMFFFGQAGCLKLSPMKTSKDELDEAAVATTSTVDANDESETLNRNESQNNDHSNDAHKHASALMNETPAIDDKTKESEQTENSENIECEKTNEIVLKSQTVNLDYLNSDKSEYNQKEESELLPKQEGVELNETVNLNKSDNNEFIKSASISTVAASNISLEKLETTIPANERSTIERLETASVVNEVEKPESEIASETSTQQDNYESLSLTAQTESIQSELIDSKDQIMPEIENNHKVDAKTDINTIETSENECRKSPAESLITSEQSEKIDNIQVSGIDNTIETDNAILTANESQNNKSQNSASQNIYSEVLNEKIGNQENKEKPLTSIDSYELLGNKSLVSGDHKSSFSNKSTLDVKSDSSDENDLSLVGTSNKLAERIAINETSNEAITSKIAIVEKLENDNSASEQTDVHFLASVPLSECNLKTIPEQQNATFSNDTEKPLDEIDCSQLKKNVAHSDQTDTKHISLSMEFNETITKNIVSDAKENLSTTNELHNVKQAINLSPFVEKKDTVEDESLDSATSEESANAIPLNESAAISKITEKQRIHDSTIIPSTSVEHINSIQDPKTLVKNLKSGASLQNFGGSVKSQKTIETCKLWEETPSQFIEKRKSSETHADDLNEAKRPCEQDLHTVENKLESDRFPAFEPIEQKTSKPTESNPTKDSLREGLKTLRNVGSRQESLQTKPDLSRSKSKVAGNANKKVATVLEKRKETEKNTIESASKSNENPELEPAAAKTNKDSFSSKQNTSAIEMVHVPTIVAPEQSSIADVTSESLNKTIQKNEKEKRSDGNETQTEPLEQTLNSQKTSSQQSNQSSRNRKRRMTDERVRKSSESEIDNVDPLADTVNDSDEEVGGKRLKMRARVPMRNLRKTAEQKRNLKAADWSTDEDVETLAKQLAKSPSPAKAQNEPNTRTRLRAKKEQIESDKLSSTKTSPTKTNKTKSEADTGKVEEIDPLADKTEEVEDDPKKTEPAKTNTKGKTNKNETHEENETTPDETAKQTPSRPARKGNKKVPVKPKEAVEESSEAIEEPKQSTENKEKDNKRKEEGTSNTDKATPKGEPRKKRRSLLGLDIAEDAIIPPNDGETPVRQSRRIAQIKIKEEAERRKEEEIALKKLKEASEKKKKGATAVSGKSLTPVVQSEEEDSEAEQKKKKKRRKGNKDRPWQTDSSDSSEKEEEDIDEHEEVERSLPPLKSDHEFSPESDIEDESQAVPTKRARTARKDKDVAEEVVDEDEDIYACQKCGKNDHPEWILLCDKCDKGYHCSCLIPVLFVIPEGNWFCPPCQQEKLIEVLETKLVEYDEAVKQRDLEEAKRQRILFTTVNEANVLRESRRKARKGKGREEDLSGDYSSSDDDENEGSSNSAEDGSNKSRNRPSRAERHRKRNETSSSATNSSDDEPIYKLRKRRQVNVSYRFNEYDDMINRAIKSEMDEVAGAGNLGRGKDISTIIEADKEEKRLKKLEQEKAERQASSNENQDESDDIKVKEEESDSEPIQARPSKKGGRRTIKKKKKLNSLDVDSEDDGSDDDFNTSSYSDEDDEEENFSGSTDDSDSSLEIYRKKGKKGRVITRRSTREHKKRFDADFIDDNSDFDEEDNIPLVRKKKKLDSDFSDSNETSEDELGEGVDSEDLCDDSSDSSDRAWGSKKSKKSKNTTKPVLASKQNHSKKKSKRKEDGEKAFKGSVIKKKVIRDTDDDDEDDVDDDDDDDEVLPKSRRTRGRKHTYLMEEDYESSDDGIKPGVKRPDTPPEEREAFIKKQEEIKRMLAEKNTSESTIEESSSKTNTSDKARKQPKDSLSTIPPQIIQTAKALDVDLKKGAIIQKSIPSDHESEGFDDDLPEDFDPEDMDEDEIAKMMEEEDFAQQQLKLAGEVIRSKKLKESDTDIKKKDSSPLKSTDTTTIPPSAIAPEQQSHEAVQHPFTGTLTIPEIPPSMYSAQATGTSKVVTTPKKRGRKIKDELLSSEIPKSSATTSELTALAQLPKTADLPIHGQTIHHPPPRNQPMPSVPPQVLHMAPAPNHPIQPGSQLQHTPSVIAHSSMLLQRNPQPPPHLQHPAMGITQQQQMAQASLAHQNPSARSITQQLIQSAIRQHQTPPQQPLPQNVPQQLPQRPPGSLLGISSSQEPIIPTTVLAVQNTKLLDPSELGQPPADNLTSPVKKRGRRKKFTPLRDSLPAAPTSAASEVHHNLPTTVSAPTLEPPKSSILSERLSNNPADKRNLGVATPPQLYSAVGSAQPSVITRLNRPPQGPPFGPPQPQRYYAPTHGPPHSISSHPRSAYQSPNVVVTSGHRQPPSLGNPLPTAAHLQHPMYLASLRRGQPMYGSPGYPSGPPQPMHRNIQTIESSGNPSQEFAGSPYHNSPYAGYYPPGPVPAHVSSIERRPGVLASTFEQYDNPNKNSPSPHDRTTPNAYHHSQPPTSHLISTITATNRHPIPEEDDERSSHSAAPGAPNAGSSSEFSGLVSYFSSQQDDLDT